MNSNDVQVLKKILKEELKPIKQKLDSHTKNLINIEDKVKVMPDLVSKLDKIDNHEERIQKLESTISFIK